MISHEMKTKMEHVTAYYKLEEHKQRAMLVPYPSMRIVQMADIVYDHKLNQFTKCRQTGNCELLNAMLMVAQNRGKITDQMWDIVNGHR